MARIPEEKEWTRKELQRKIKWTRRFMPILELFLQQTGKVIGKELYLDTEEGKVRVLFHGENQKKMQPLYVNMHGGGFTAGDAEADEVYMERLAKQAGIKICNIDYSLAPEYPFPTALNQCYAVTLYLKEHAEDFGIDSDRIAIGGHSAGGNLAAAVTLMDQDRQLLKIKAVIMDYPPMDIYTDPYLKHQPRGCIPPGMARIANDCYLQPKKARKNPLVSPVFAEIEQLKNFPTSLIITASGDILCKETEDFKELLINAGCEVEFKRFEAAHGFTHKKGRMAEEAWNMMGEYLKRKLY